MRLYRPLWPVCSVALLLVSSCGDRPLRAPADAVATVGATAITAPAFEQALHQRGYPNPTEEQKQGVLEELIRFELLHQAAKKEGWETNPAVQRAIKNVLVGHYREKLEAGRPRPFTVSDAEIEAFYRANTNRFLAAEQIQVAMIFLPMPGKANPEMQAALARQAESLRATALAEVARNLSFGLLAQSNSAHQASRYRGGDLGWVTRPVAAAAWEPAMVEAIFTLQKPAEISPVVPGKDGYYLFKLMGKKRSGLRPLAEVRAAIASQLAREKETAWETGLFSRLKSGIPIKVNREALKSIKGTPPPEPKIPPSPAN